MRHDMLRVDGFYLYSVGAALHPLSGIQANDPFNHWLYPLYIAQNSLEMFLVNSVYQHQVSGNAGVKLLNAIKGINNDSQRTLAISTLEAYQLRNTLAEFEHVLTAEFGL